MKAEQEIVLQKKMIIIFTLVILVFTMGILNIQKTKLQSKNLEENNEEIKIYTQYTANEELFKVEVSGETSGDVVESELNENVVAANSEINSSEVKSDISEKNDERVIPEEVVVQPNVDNQVELNEEDGQEMVEVASRGSYIRDTSTPPTEYEKVIKVKATAYCLCKKCCGKSPDNPRYGYTASGLRIVPGKGMKVIAVDTSLVKLGTNVYVEGLNGAQSYGYAVAADTGSAIKNNKIDLYMDTHKQALAWGYRYVNLYILEN